MAGARLDDRALWQLLATIPRGDRSDAAFAASARRASFSSKPIPQIPDDVPTPSGVFELQERSTHCWRIGRDSGQLKSIAILRLQGHRPTDFAATGMQRGPSESYIFWSGSGRAARLVNDRDERPIYRSVVVKIDQLADEFEAAGGRPRPG
jgi:hypothetical protein